MKKVQKIKKFEKINNDEIILINETEYILNNGKVYEIKKAKGQIYGYYNEDTHTVKTLNTSIRKIIEYLSEITDTISNILWLGVDLPIIQDYFPNLTFYNIDDLTNINLIEFSICICNNYSKTSNTNNNLLCDLINNKIMFISKLLGSNTNILCFESKDLFHNIISILNKNNFKIIDEELEFSNKLCYIMGIKKLEIEKKGIMVLDTETTGFPNSSDPQNWEKFNNARLIEIGYIIYDSIGNKIKEYESLIKPDNWTIKNTFVHGIDQNNAITNGKPINNIFADLLKDLDNVNAFVCHNINFDMNIILAESYRANQIDLAKKIESKKKICTMELGKKFMKINKKPKLIELYKFIFKQEFKQEHRALSDCVACADCFYNMTC